MDDVEEASLTRGRGSGGSSDSDSESVELPVLRLVSKVALDPCAAPGDGVWLASAGDMGSGSDALSGMWACSPLAKRE